MSTPQTRRIPLLAVTGAAVVRLAAVAVMWATSLTGSSRYPSALVVHRWSVPVAMAIATVGVLRGSRKPVIVVLGLVGLGQHQDAGGG